MILVNRMSDTLHEIRRLEVDVLREFQGKLYTQTNICLCRHISQGGRKRCSTVALLRGTKTKREAQKRRKIRGSEKKRKKGGEEEEKRKLAGAELCQAQVQLR